MERDMNPMPDDLTPEELMAEADAAEALPERAAMSTLNVTSLDTAGAAVEAVGDGVPDGAPAEPAPAPVVSDTGATAAEHAPQPGPPDSTPGAEHSAAPQHNPHSTAT